MATEDSHLMRAFEQIPSGLFLLTSAHDGMRSGMLARWVQQCSTCPPQVMVALPKGTPVEPLIRDSRCFAICQVPADDRLLRRKFSTPPERTEDPFDTLQMSTAPLGSPIVIDRAMSYLECAVARQVELDADHWIYVGRVHCGSLLRQTRPAVHLGSNGTIDYELDSDAGTQTKRRYDDEVA